MKLTGMMLCSVLCVLSVPALAEVYKWVDENGKVHFGDRAPADKPAENIADSLEKTNVDEASKQHASSLGTPDSSRKTADEELLVLRKRQALEEQIGKRCRTWLEEIKTIARGDPVRFLDEEGNEEVVMERDRGKKLLEWKEGYRQYGCEELYPLE